MSTPTKQAGEAIRHMGIVLVGQAHRRCRSFGEAGLPCSVGTQNVIAVLAQASEQP